MQTKNFDLTVNAGCLCFVEASVSENERDDALKSLLLAQLVANKKCDRFLQPRSWIDAFFASFVADGFWVVSEKATHREKLIAKASMFSLRQWLDGSIFASYTAAEQEQIDALILGLKAEVNKLALQNFTLAGAKRVKATAHLEIPALRPSPETETDAARPTNVADVFVNVVMVQVAVLYPGRVMQLETLWLKCEDLANFDVFGAIEAEHMVGPVCSRLIKAEQVESLYAKARSSVDKALQKRWKNSVVALAPTTLNGGES
jgi:hypothetical protein